MHIGLKITLGVLGAGALFGIGYAIHRSIRSKKEDDLTLDIGTVDWANKIVPYTLKQGKQTISTSKAGWLLPGTTDFGKNIIVQVTRLTNGLVIQASVNGDIKAGKTIDFNSKTVKDFTGNVSNAIAGATQTLTNLFG